MSFNMNIEAPTDPNIEKACEVLKRNGYTPRNKPIVDFAKQLLNKAEENFIAADKNALFSEDGQLDEKVFAAWLAEITVSDFDT